MESLRRHILIVGLLVIVVGFVAASDTLHDRTEVLIVWAESVIAAVPAIGMVLFVLLAMLSAMVAFFSSAVLAPVAIYAWGKVTCLLLLWTGWLLGGVASFCIGRFLGRRVAASLIGEEKIQSWQAFVSQRSRFLHILMFQAVVPSEIPGYVLGILRYRFGFYLAALAIAELPYVIAVVYLGESFLAGEGTVFVLLGLVMLALAAILLGVRRH